MMRRFVVICIGLVLMFSLPAFADDKTGFYVGIGGSYAIQSFETRGTETFDNAVGGNVKIGFKESKVSATELVLDYFHEFKWTHYKDFITSKSGSVQEKVSVFSAMLAQKFSIPNDKFRPYLVLGIGLMSVKSDSGPNLQFSDGNGFCYKGGLGLDYFATNNISLGLEGNYVFGTGDVRYANATVGVAYHF